MSNITIHEYDDYAYYTGLSKVISNLEPIPQRWTDANLPEIPAGHFARFWDGKWVIVEQPKPINIIPADWQPGAFVERLTPDDVEQTEPQVL